MTFRITSIVIFPMDSPSQLKGDIFVGWRFPILESPSIGLYEFHCVGDDLEGASHLSIISLPLVLIEDSNDRNPGPFMEIG